MSEKHLLIDTRTFHSVHGCTLNTHSKNISGFGDLHGMASVPELHTQLPVITFHRGGGNPAAHSSIYIKRGQKHQSFANQTPVGPWTSYVLASSPQATQDLLRTELSGDVERRCRGQQLPALVRLQLVTLEAVGVNLRQEVGADVTRDEARVRDDFP